VTLGRVQALRFWEALDAFATAQEPAVAKALHRAIQDARASLTDAELERIVTTGDVDAILERIDFNAVKFALRDAATSAGEQTPEGFAGISTGGQQGIWPQIIRVRFDTLAPYAVAALRDFESKAIDALREEVRSGVIAEIRNGVTRGLNPRQTARELRELIGLPDNLVQAITSYRSALQSGNRTELKDALERALRDKRFDRSLLTALQGDQAMDPARIDRMVTRYAERALTHHTETIARTATMDALNQGNRMAWQQAITDGKVSVHDLRRFWVVARDERTCVRCLTIPLLNPLGRGMDEPFVTPFDGLVMLPTLHFRCRCIVYTKYIG
jgi:hypothetical protein